MLLLNCLQSCGSCKQVLQHCSQLCQENSQQKAGVLFLKHNVWNEFDDLTDVARMYKAKAVPSFIFLTGGAMVRRLQIACCIAFSQNYVEPCGTFASWASHCQQPDATPDLLQTCGVLAWGASHVQRNATKVYVDLHYEQ